MLILILMLMWSPSVLKPQQVIGKEYPLKTTVSGFALIIIKFIKLNLKIPKIMTVYLSYPSVIKMADKIVFIAFYVHTSSLRIIW